MFKERPYVTFSATIYYHLTCFPPQNALIKVSHVNKFLLRRRPFYHSFQTCWCYCESHLGLGTRTEGIASQDMRGRNFDFQISQPHGDTVTGAVAKRHVVEWSVVDTDFWGESEGNVSVNDGVLIQKGGWGRHRFYRTVVIPGSFTNLDPSMDK